MLVLIGSALRSRAGLLYPRFDAAKSVGNTVLTAADVRTVQAKAIAFLQRVREPHALLFMGVIHRRYGVAEFADTLQRFDEVLPDHLDRAPVLRVFRRMFDASNPIQPEDWEHITLQTDRLLVAALYSDRLGLPPNYAEALDKAVAEGGYGATHALLAWIWVQENRCELELPDGFVEKMYGTVAAIVNEDPTSVSDIKLEAAAFLCLARQSARLNLGFVQRVIAFQNPDGGWGTPAEGAGNPEGSSWHSTILALMIVLCVKFPGQDT